MLQNIHDRTKGWIAWVILSLVCVTFALWGIQSYLGGSADTDKLATVNGTNITRQQVNATYERLFQQQQLQSDAVNPALEQQLKKQALEQLISSQILSQAARSTGYRVSDAQVAAAIQSIPAFRVDGQFSPSRFREALYSMSYSEPTFIADIHASMVVNQPRAGMISSAFGLPAEIHNAIQLMRQTRDISYLTIPVSRFLKDAAVTDDGVQAYYKTHQQRFNTPEKISLEYIELALKDLKSTTEKTADKLFTELSEQLENIAYTHPDSLEPVAKATGLPIKKTSLFNRDAQITDDKSSLLAHPKVIAAAFSADVLEQKNNSSLIELSPERVVIIRVKEHQKPAIQPLETAKQAIISELKLNEAKIRAEQLGKTILAALQKGKSKETVAAQYQLAWTNKTAITRDDSNVPAAILNTAFSLPRPSANTGIALDSGDAIVLLLTKITDGSSAKTTSIERQVIQEQLAQAYGETDYELYQREWIDKANIKRTNP